MNTCETIAWDTHFTKGWTSEQAWRDYMQARDEKSFFEMDCILRSEGAERRPVDSRIWATTPKDLDLYEAYPSAPDAFGSEIRDIEHEQLVQLSKLRDVPLKDLPMDLPESLRKNSYFAKLIRIQPYTPAVDYMTDKAEYDFIQAGNQPVRVQEHLEGYRSPETGRDWATYVHKDNPMAFWTLVIQEIMRLKVPTRISDNNDTVCREDAAFVTGGMPFWWGLIGDVIDRIGPINFMSKHAYMADRPEGYAQKRFETLLAMAFAEGSPISASFTAIGLGRFIRLISSHMFFVIGRSSIHHGA